MVVEFWTQFGSRHIGLTVGTWLLGRLLYQCDKCYEATYHFKM
jgi:hypothetical protein